MLDLHGLCDDWYLNVVVQTEMDLPSNRETVLHFFEQVQKTYSTRARFFSRDKGDYVLEEDRDGGSYRWASVEAKRLQSGVVNPLTLQTACQQHQQLLQIATYALSLSHLDNESLSVVFGFDYQYSGNQSTLIADVLGVPLGLSSIVDQVGSSLVAYEPGVQFAITSDLQTQARLSFETRGVPFSIRESEPTEASDEILSVYLTLRRFEALPDAESFVTEFDSLVQHGCELLRGHIINGILRPLQSAIAAG